MKLWHLFFCISIIGNNSGAMLAEAAALAANPTVQQLAAPAITALVAHETNTFAHSSFFTNLVGHSHADQASTALQTLAANAPAILQQAPAIINALEQPSSAAAPALPQLQAANAQQAALGLVLQAAQNTEQNLQNNPSSKAKVLRVLIGLCAAGFGAADLAVNYLYAQKTNDSTTGKKVTSGIFSAGTDLGIFTFGAYQAYLGIVNWDAAAKQKDAAVATQLVQGQLAQVQAASGAVVPAVAARATV